MKQPKYDINRGRHRKRASLETHTWNREHLIPPKPHWMPEQVYTALARLREGGER